MRGKGIGDANLSINWGDLMKRKRGFTDPVPRNMEDSLSENGVDTLHGVARFTDRNSIKIDSTSYDATHFLVATGARPRPLDFPGHEHLVDSTDFLNLQVLPPRILFVGGGFVSFEFAHICARAGSTSVIIDRGPRPLKGFDPDLVGLLITRGIEAGIEPRRSTTITAIERSQNGYAVSVQRSGLPEAMEFDLAVHGAGRVPELSGLDLDAAGVAWDEHGVHVAAHLQSTTNPAVYAAGGSANTPGIPLTPVAVFEGKVAATNMLKGATTVPDYAGVPTAVFTIPSSPEWGCSNERLGTKASMSMFATATPVAGTPTTGSAKRPRPPRSWSTDAGDRIVGAHLLGPEYGELNNFLALAIKLGLTTRQLKSMTAAYPTMGSDLGSML